MRFIQIIFFEIVPMFSYILEDVQYIQYLGIVLINTLEVLFIVLSVDYMYSQLINGLIG